MFYVVNFHADGGQMCVPGRRVFDNRKEADIFAKKCEDEKSHLCKNSVSIEEQVDDPGDLGYIYPMIAMLGRNNHV